MSRVLVAPATGALEKTMTRMNAGRIFADHPHRA
jgi:hypothetical protein